MMKNKVVVYLDSLIKMNERITKETNAVLRSKLFEAERSCKKYRYDDDAHELACGSTYLHKIGNTELNVSREDCLSCGEYEPKEKVK